MTSPNLQFVRDHPSTLPRLDRDAALRRVRSGAYVESTAWSALTPWERYRLRVLAVARTWTAPVFCLESAASLHSMPVFGEPRFIHLLSDSGRSWTEGDVVVHGMAGERAAALVDGMSVTSVADTALDLCRVLPPAFGLALADHAVRSGHPLTGLSRRGRDQANRRGVRSLDWIEPRIDPRSESVGESVSRAVIEWLGYSAPEPQVTFDYEGETDRVDMYWRRERVVGESDGYGKYDSDDAAGMKEHFVREKRREDRLRRHESGFARWDWSDTMRWRPLDAALRSAGLVPTHPVDRARLATLATNPRSHAPVSRTKASR